MRNALVLLFVAAAMLAQDPAKIKEALQLVNDGNTALADREYTTAVRLLKQALALQPADAAAWGALGRSYLALDQVDAAIDACEKQIAFNPAGADAYNSFGLALWRKEKRGEAIAAFRKQIEINPQHIPKIRQRDEVTQGCCIDMG